MKQYTKEDICNLNPYDLLELALEDLERVEKDPRYEVNMDDWYVPINGICYVCLAGSVMARFIEPDDDTVSEFGNDIHGPMYALDEFRCGSISGGLDEMGYTGNPEFGTMEVTKYGKDPKQFKEDMRKILKMLKENPPVKKEEK